MADKIQIVTPCGDGKYGLFTIVEGQVFRAWASYLHIPFGEKPGYRYFQLITEMRWFCVKSTALYLFIHNDLHFSNNIPRRQLKDEIIRDLEIYTRRHYSTISGFYEIHIHEDEINAVRDNPALFEVLDNYIPEPKSDSWRYSIGDVYAK